MKPPPSTDAWDPWTPSIAAEHLSGLEVPWGVVGGYAIDLFLQRQTRQHDDIEIAILRGDYPIVRSRLHPLVPHAAGSGVVRRLADGESPPDGIHQTWMLDDQASAWRIDVMLEPGDPEEWVFRRDARVRAPRREMIGTCDGIRYLLPHGTLLYKAKAVRPKDEIDLRNALPSMTTGMKEWLRAALHLLHPGHPWIELV